MRSCRAGHLQETVEVMPLQVASPTGSHHVHPRVCLSWHQGALFAWWSQHGSASVRLTSHMSRATESTGGEDMGAMPKGERSEGGGRAERTEPRGGPGAACVPTVPTAGRPSSL